MTTTKTCSACEGKKELKTDRLPRGWKVIADQTYCQRCVRDRFALRAIALPVVGPLHWAESARHEPRTLDWPEFRGLLRDAWIATTQASNLIMRRLALADPGIAEGRIQPMPRVYCYPEIRERWPELPTSAVNCLEQAAQGRYRKLRRELLTYQMSLPTMRYPVPMPIHNATWRVWEEDGGRLLLSFQLGGGRITVVLRGGHHYRRQRAGVRRIIAGEAVQGELSIYRVRANPGDHRNGDTPRTRVMAKMVAWFPRQPKGEGPVFTVRSGGDAFLTLSFESGDRVFRWHCRHVLRRIVRHDRELGQLRDDMKAERRLRRERDGILARMELVSANMRDYLHTHCHETSRELVNLVARRRGRMLVYDDTDKSYLPHFPWHKLSTMVEDKCRRAGIEFMEATP